MKFEKREQYLIFGIPDIRDSEINEVVSCLNSKWLGTGPRVHAFEEQFRQYVNSSFALAVNSCTAGLHLSLLAAKIGAGDEVITCPMTFASTANVIIHSGATPVFVDCIPFTGLIDPTKIEAAINEKTKAILAIHLYGRPCNMAALRDIAERHNLALIGDAAHAIEAEYDGKKVGTLADLNCFSFYATKNLVTGEGGMVTTDNPQFAADIPVFALHGLSKDAWQRYSDDGYKHYEVVYPGFKYNMMDLQAALGIHQLERIEKAWSRRDEIWQRYLNAFKALPIGTPPPDEANIRHARHLFTLLVDQEDCGLNRDEFIQQLHRLNIGAGVHYRAVHLHEYYRKRFNYRPEDFPNASYLSDRTLSLPLGPSMSEVDVDDVIATVHAILEGVS